MGITADTPLLAPRRTIGFLSGDPQADSVKVVVASFTDAAITVDLFTSPARTGSPVATGTIAASGGSSPKLAKYGDDRTEFVYVGPGEEDYDYVSTPDDAGQTWLCYVGSTTITGLSPNTRYYIKLTQGATVELDASTCTAPAAGTDFKVYFAGCDDSHLYRYVPGGGGWKNMKRDILAEYDECKYLVYADDLGYADWLRTTSQGGDDVVSGKRMDAKSINNPTVYNYGWLYIAMLGMLGQGATSELEWAATQARMFCLRNMPGGYQWGDHEFQNDCGHTFGTYTYSGVEGTIPGSTPALDTPWYAPGKAAWDALWGALAPTPSIRTLDPAANHWAWSLGDLLVLAPDSITNGSGTVSANPLTMIDGLLGVDQIDDLLAAADTSHPFKAFVLPTFDLQGWMVPTGTLGETDGTITQIPLETAAPDEYEQLIWAASATPKSLRDNPKTNGTDGVTVFMHGDIHRAAVHKYEGHQSKFDSVGPTWEWVVVSYGPTGGQENITVAETVLDRWESGSWQGLTDLWHPPGQVYRPSGSSTNSADLENWPSYSMIEVRGSLATKEIVVNLYQIEDETNVYVPLVWTGTFRVGSNLPVP